MRTEELPMSSVLKYCLKPPPSQAYNSLSQPPPWHIQWQCFRWKKKILNAHKNETGLSVGRLCECSCSHWRRYFLMKTWNYIIYLNNSLKSCPLSEGHRWAWQHLTPANMCSASAAECSDSCTKGQRHVQHNELARRWCNIRNGFKMLSLATFPLIEPSWERHSVGFTLIASTMRVMNGKSWANKITPGHSPSDVQLKWFQYERKIQSTAAVSGEIARLICVSISVSFVTCVLSTQQQVKLQTDTHSQSKQLASKQSKCRDKQQKFLCRNSWTLTPLNIFTLT